MNIFKTESGIGDGQEAIMQMGAGGRPGGIAEVRMTGKDGEEEL